MATKPLKQLSLAYSATAALTLLAPLPLPWPFPCRWVLSQGAATQLAPAMFNVSGGLRGCAAVADLPAGSTAVSLPSNLLMTYKTAAESDFGAVLNRMGLDPETLAVVWTMVDRWDADSPAKPLWQALPQRFSTGLSVPQQLLDLMSGLQEQRKFSEARQHVQGQFQQLQQAFT